MYLQIKKEKTVYDKIGPSEISSVYQSMSKSTLSQLWINQNGAETYELQIKYMLLHINTLPRFIE